MTVQNAYNHWAKTYDTDDNRTRDLDAIVTEDALKNVLCDSILELGCGTGKNTQLLAELGQSVQALDFSREMIAKAKIKITAKNVQFTQTDLTQVWPSPDQFVDLIVCNLVLEHIEDIGFIFSEASRTLAPGGRFFISELHPFKQYLGLQAVFVQGDEIIKVDAYVHHMSDFLNAASGNGLKLLDVGEWWHENDQNKPPRLITFMFQK